MKKYNLITPEGTRDLLFDESVIRREILGKINSLFTSYGFSEVITPTFEFYDVFSSNYKHFTQESMYKLSDSKGRLLVIRPDSTLPIARLAATRLKEQPIPLKLFYNQNIFRANPKNMGRDDEISQSGIEIIGGNEKAADFEAVSLALEVLKNLDKDSYRLEIGSIEFFKILMKELGTNDDTIGVIRQLLEKKNYPELEQFLNDYPENDTTKAIRMLPTLFGGMEVFEKAAEYFKTPELKHCLNKLKCIYTDICNYIGDYKDRIYVDLGMVSKADFYSGTVFKGLIEGHGKPVLSGGRYDTLMCNFGICSPATGFAVDNNAAIDAYLVKNKTVETTPIDMYVFIDNDFLASGMKHIQTLISEGKRIYNIPVNSREEAVKYANAKNAETLLIIDGSGTEIIYLGVQSE